MSASLVVAPLIPWPAIAALALVGALLVGIAALRRGRAWPLRAAVLLVLVAALFNPSIFAEQREPRPDVALIMVDESPSQRVGDRTRRTEAALARLPTALAAGDPTALRVVRFGGETGDQGTRLAAPLQRAIADIPVDRRAGVVILSDGQIHDLGEDTPPPEIGAPVHVLLTGDASERDRRLVVEQAPAFGLVGQDVTLGYHVDDLHMDDRDDDGGSAAAERAGAVAVRIRIDGRDAGTEYVQPGEVASRRITLEHAGATVIELAAEAVPGELSTVNNRAVVSVGGVRERLRVLLISGQPHPGERVWRNLLKADPAVDLVHFTILRPPDKGDSAAINELSLIAFPVDELFEEKLYDFDLILFDRYTVRGILPWRYLGRVADYVAAGGALLLSVGPEFTDFASLYRTPIGPVLPGAPTGRIFEQAFRPTITQLGRRHPVTTALPGQGAGGDGEAGSGGPGAEPDAPPDWGRWFRLVEVEARAGSTLMTGPNGLPLLLVDRVADGRVALLTSDHLWLWARGHDGGGPHAELLRRLVHWLMQEPELEEERLTARIDDGRLAVQRRSLATDPVTVTVTGPDDTARTLTLSPGADGVARGTLAADTPGLWRVDDGRATALAASGPLNPLEYRDLRATDEHLAPLAQATGGSVRRLVDGMPQVRRVRPGGTAHGSDWIGLVRNDASAVTGITRVPLLPGLVVLALALAGLATAWWREGR